MRKAAPYLYIPLTLLFIVAGIVFVKHARPIAVGLLRLADQQNSVRFPFELRNRVVVGMLPEASTAGMLKGDKVVAVNGHVLNADSEIILTLRGAHVGEDIVYTVERTSADGETERVDIPAKGVAMVMSYSQVATNFAITLLFALCLPGISFLLGFYIAFIRPRDPLAWILLLLLLGIGSIAMEGWPEGTLVRTFQEVMRGNIGVALVLFGIYFPERSEMDRKRPWTKWIFLVPVLIGGILTSIEQIARFFDLPAVWEPLDRLTAPYDQAFTVLAMVAFGFFFASLASKSASSENPDTRRRLRLLYFGSAAALLPALMIILYRIVSGKQGGFFELVPPWFAIIALVALLLFPLTMAYVIVVQRAMDVSVVIRQGLQYALARNGIIAVQIVLSFIVILVAVTFISDSTTNRPQKITFIGAGITIVFLLRLVAGKARIWMDKKFFREAYNAEQILSDLSDDVRTMVETQPLLETVAGKISESLHVPQVSLLLREGDEFVPAYSLGFDTEPRVALGSGSKAMRKLAGDQPILLYDDMTEVTSTPTMSLSDREQLAELNSQLLLPVASKNVLSGIISLSPKRSEEPYTTSDLRLLRSVATQTGLALENSRLTEVIAREAAQKERLSTELEIAREVQERLFPQELPTVEGLDFYGACRPALGVGGDYYDFLELPDGKFGIAIGDISGKGVGASLMMASLQASLRGQVIHFGDDLASLMRQVNSLVYEASTTNRYATFFYAQFDPATRQLSYVNAGHNPPFLIRASGEVVLLEDGGPVVGMLPPMIVSYSQGTVQLAAGDILVGYTDGISEAMNPADEEWSEDAMLARLKEIREHSAAEILELTVASADEFASGAKQHDDMTMIVVKVIQ